MAVSQHWLRRRLLHIAMFGATTFLLFGYFGAYGLARPYHQIPTTYEPSQGNVSLLVTLPGYGSFQGTHISAATRNTQLARSSVDAWLNVEYSTQPVGQDRFTAVQAPAAFDGIRDASKSGPACFQDIFAAFPQSEACLTLNIYRPTGVPMDQKLPALVWIHGGSFVTGSHSSFDGATFVEKSEEPVMIITMQYRLGALGNLPSMFMQDEGLLNLGLRDQKQALEFLQQYLDCFGGDAKRITLGGQSAGGHSVGIHLFHDYGADANQPLFHQVILSSGSPTARAFPGVDYPLYQRQVEQFMNYVNCPASPNSAALDCLRSADVDDLQYISSSIYNTNNPNITWPWQPVSPGPLFEKRGSTSGEDGTFFKLPTLVEGMTNEGNGFVPHNLANNAQFLTFWQTLVPGLNTQDIADLQILYPDSNSTNAQAATFISKEYERVAASYGDYSYICPVQDTASRLANAGAPVYKARFNTPNFAPVYQGVPHASDSAYFQGKASAQFPEIADLWSAYWASFIVSGDPNTYARNGSAEWETYQPGDGYAGRQMAVNRPSEGGPRMENERDTIRMQQCQWWRDDARAVRINK
ncbi:hypothetical protein ACEQ8H_002798 [Pleosporales sp. CAS-2024a]